MYHHHKNKNIYSQVSMYVSPPPPQEREIIIQSPSIYHHNKLLSAHKHLCENLTSPYLMEFLEYCLITNCCLLTNTDSKKMRPQIGNMGPPTLEILAHPDFQNGLTCGVWFWWNHIGNFGLPIFPLWVWFWCVVFVKLYWKYWLAHNSNMGSPVVCGFRETIMEIWASQYWKSWRAHIGKIGNILLHGQC